MLTVFSCTDQTIALLVKLNKVQKSNRTRILQIYIEKKMRKVTNGTGGKTGAGPSRSPFD